jgi:hypothetical protein
MAWVSYQRITNGVQVAGKFGESLVVTERWQIRVDSPLTSKAEILVGVSTTSGVTWGSSHPEFSALKAMEFDLSPEADGMRWILTVRYYVPPATKKPQAGSGIPADAWEFAGSTTTVPVFVDTSGVTITNAAGDPLEGLEKERHEFGWTLRKNYSTEAAFNSAAGNYPGRVNSASWAGGAAKTWKCYLRGAKKVSVSKLDGSSDGETLDYIEATWEFKYDPGTWKCMPWDVGFMELVSGSRKAILDSTNKAVKQPVALNTNGTKRSDGSKPLIINSGNGVDIYDTANFTTGFGTPALLT